MRRISRGHLRLVASGGVLLITPAAPPPPTDITTPARAMTIMRRCADILCAAPRHGMHYSDAELAAQYAATDRMVEAFRALERLTQASGVHPVNASEETHEKGMQ